MATDVHVLLDRKSWDISVKKVYRTYGNLGMQPRQRLLQKRQ
jgi:hypothetical protein